MYTYFIAAILALIWGPSNSSIQHTLPVYCVILSFIFRPPANLDSHTSITIGDNTFRVEADDLITQCVLGSGAYGVVEKMLHVKTNTLMAVKVSILVTLHMNIFKYQ